MKRQHPQGGFYQIWITNCHITRQRGENRNSPHSRNESELTQPCVTLRSGDDVFGVGSSPCGRADNVTFSNSSCLSSWWASGHRRRYKRPKSSTLSIWISSLPVETARKRSGRTRTPRWILISVAVSWSTGRPPARAWRQVCSEAEPEAEHMQSCTFSAICSSNSSVWRLSEEADSTSASSSLEEHF